MKLGPLSLAALVALVLAGCASGTPAAAPAPTRTVSQVVATETPTPTPTDPTDPADWRISAQGLGPAKLGMPIDDAVRSLAPAWTALPAPEGCSVPELRFVGPAGAAEGGSVMLVPDQAGRLAQIMIMLSGPTSSEGLGVGSTSGDVVAARPDAVASLRAGVDPLLTVAGDPGAISFESSAEGAAAPIITVWIVEGGVPNPEYCGS